MELIVVRHGQTEWNVSKKVQGQADIPLNNMGIAQANNLRKSLKDEKFDIVISSPLLRARQTAKILCENKNIIYEDRLKERDFGEFEGLRINQFDADSFWSYKKNNVYKKAENIKMFFNRVNSCIVNMEEKYKDKKVLVVTHTGTIIAIDTFFNGVPEDDNFFKHDFKNCKIFKYSILI